MLNKFLKLTLFFVLGTLFYMYYDEIGIFFLENILVIDVGAITLSTVAVSKSVVAKKTFLVIVKKIGYKKLFFSIFWVILKRYVIETSTNYFKKHSFERFKNNFLEVVKMKFQDIKKSSLSKKLIAFFSFITGSSLAYYLLTNFLSKIIIGVLQKFFYAIVLVFWQFFALFIGIFIFLLSYIIQLFFIVKIINYIEKFTIVKLFYKIVNEVFRKILSFFDTLLGTKLHLSLIRISRNLDRYFASILDKNFTPYERVQRTRDRYINTIEYISIKRQKYKLNRKTQKVSLFKEYDRHIKKYIKKEKTWREKREIHFKKLELKREKINRRVQKKTVRTNKLTLPFKKN